MIDFLSDQGAQLHRVRESLCGAGWGEELQTQHEIVLRQLLTVETNICASLCMHVCIYICMCMYVYICASRCMCAYTLHVCAFMSMYVHVCICMCVYVHVRASMCMYVQICVHICASPGKVLSSPGEGPSMRLTCIRMS